LIRMSCEFKFLISLTERNRIYNVIYYTWFNIIIHI
jgi:hypothetical protein